MKIVLVNDDGYDAIGIEALASALYKEHHILVVAPNKEMSGMSHSASFFKPVNVEKITNKPWDCYSVDGTPVDCVMLAVLEFCKDARPDLVLCGINNVPNLATDIMFSGTVQQAIEGIYLGVNSVAVSGNLRNADDMNIVAKWVKENLNKLYEMSKITAISVNFPKLYKENFKWDVKFTELGYNAYNDTYLYEPNGKNKGKYTLVGEVIPYTQRNEDCDINWYRKGYITISPLSITLNDEKLLEKIKEVKW